MALVADCIDRSLTLLNLPDATDNSIEQVRITLNAQLDKLPLVLSPVLPSAFAPSQFLTSNFTLDRTALVAERIQNQTKSTAKAVRQRGRVLALPMNGRTLRRFVEQGPTLREALTMRLAAVAPVAPSAAVTSGVGRKIRYTGSPMTSDQTAGNIATKNKETVRNVAAATFIRLRGRSFAQFQGIHENVHIGNVATYNVLSPGHLVIALHEKRKEVLLGEVITMYSKGGGKNAKHDWIATADSIGLLSNIYIRVFVPFSGQNTFTSMACPLLSCSTIIRIPRTHLLFSLQSFHNTTNYQNIPTPAGHPLTILTLCPVATTLLQKFCRQAEPISTAIQHLRKSLREKANNMETGDNIGGNRDGLDGSDDDIDEEEGQA